MATRAEKKHQEMARQRAIEQDNAIRELSIRMIRDRQPDWPAYPILPLKRRKSGDSWPELGFIWAARPYEVILGNMLMFKGDDVAEKIQYRSAEEIVDDGWMVD